MTRVSARTHADGIVALVIRIEENGKTLYIPEFPPPSRIPVTGRHSTEQDAQAEADQIMAANNDHVCDGCAPWTPLMPGLGDTKPCIVERCEGTMTWQIVHPPDAYFAKDGAELPEPTPDYEAWVCSDCGWEQRGSN